MRTGPASLLIDAWRLWRADWNVLSAVAGLFLFLPALAQNMLFVSGWPAPPKGPQPGTPIDDAAAQRYLDAMSGWFGSVGIWLLASLILAYFAQLAIASFYVARPRHDVGQSLAAGVARLPIYLVSALVASFPIMLGYMLLVLPAFYVMGRLALAAPLIAAEPGTGPIRALTRSLALTRGNGLAMMSVTMTVVLAALIIGLSLNQIDDWLVASQAGPVALVLLDFVMAAAGAIGSLAAILVQVAAYRRLSPSSPSAAGSSG